MILNKIGLFVLCFLLSVKGIGQTVFNPDKPYVIKARISNNVVSIAAYPSLQQREYAGVEEQFWKFEVHPDKTVTIINMAHQMALTSPDSTRSAAFLFLMPADQSIRQKWVIKKIDNENIALVSKFSNQAVDIMEGAHFNGAYIMQWPLSGVNQYWQIKNKRDDGYMVLSAFISGKMLTADKAAEMNGANIYQWEYSGKDWQKWYIQPVPGNLFRLISVHSKKAMQVSTGLYTQAGNIEQGEYCGMPWQHWRIIPLKGGYQFQSVFSGKILDIIIRGVINGTNMVEYENHQGENQIFTIVEAESLVSQ